MISLDKAVIARYEKQGITFEVYVEPENARKIRNGEDVSVDDTIVSRDIYSDARKGKRAADSDLNKVFGTTDFDEILIKILKEGEIQLTTDEKRKMQEERKKQVIALIARSAVDPQSHLPHPPQRIEMAMDEAKLHIDPMQDAEKQVDKVLAALKPILPIKMETNEIAVHIPAQHATRIYGFLKSHNMKKQEWEKDGSLVAVVVLPAGQQADFYDKLNKMTSGQIETKVIGEKGE